ncbi:Lipoprotein vacJ precursor [Candidatus Glomeribacter gigasporarum BEG34]|uniref:Lipoprotein vacJ n=1 Tax=Candidatus Glomeribacter gigasporarum BEG34 TaxID=1070319 RepID=G2J7G7_9BURK|nr:VacJ family lipoprotein [Candidatus Glomeribacter gigasporarum]CCD28712.1 Lipoprotein vacJ precursor [Candidatus Glomeribacter gigasporarum BEG34]
METHFSKKRLFTLLVLTAGLAACANVRAPVRSDPWEGMNRAMFEFNDTVDRAALQPVARVYHRTLPQGVRTRVSNFFSNLGDVPVMANYLLQGQWAFSAESLMRIAINTLFGVGGLFDVAQEVGLPKRRTDFGLTFGRYGIPAGPYLVLPLLGPSTVRDTAGTFFDYSANPVSYVNPALLSYGLYGVRMISARAALLQAGNLLSEAALDKYSFVRNAYLQRRAYFSGAHNRNGPPRDEDEGASSSGSVAAPPAEQHIPSQQMIPPHIMPQIHLGW